jgi:hypothetical protein
MPHAAKVFNRKKRRKSNGGATKDDIDKVDSLTMGDFVININRSDPID